ncbi:hypothetical protein IWQ47_003447 [Aquimarina sp. EL_43]|uniref:hypothetical protein n=1 Tax=Aquimarina TaxID=290174 RepID=UPI0004B0C3DF|nr:MULTISPECIES: hypothetical protein [Aquimarina]MBG6131811.1 hypothetical protein [Aquimarina sp. EL_35]MBG6149375.1 hypothetical protein [Aquimarina sp. EL_32]MBG6170362.1 hypothetical protein [Aquimarina sp. EL_43]
MRTFLYLLMTLFITANLASCTADNINDTEDISVETVATGDDGQVNNDEDNGGN